MMMRAADLPAFVSLDCCFYLVTATVNTSTNLRTRDQNMLYSTSNMYSPTDQHNPLTFKNYAANWNLTYDNRTLIDDSKRDGERSRWPCLTSARGSTV